MRTRLVMACIRTAVERVHPSVTLSGYALQLQSISMRALAPLRARRVRWPGLRGRAMAPTPTSRAAEDCRAEHVDGYCIQL